MSYTVNPLDYAAKHLPEGYEIHVNIERGAGEVEIFDPYGEIVELDYEDDEQFFDTIIRAVGVAQADAESTEVTNDNE